MAFSPDKSRDRVARAVSMAGPNASLVGFEAVGIQQFIAANGRPLGMEGASRIITRFDEENRQRSGMIFAGGGRGLAVVPEPHKQDFIAARQDRYREITHGGQLAVASVPFDMRHQAESLRWLRMQLDGAKDVAKMPNEPLPTGADKVCADCRVRACTSEYPGPEGPVPSCKRCAAVVAAGRDSTAEQWTFENIANEDRCIALVCADGNNLGALFAGLRSLEEQAVCSDLVSAIFYQAHSEACPRGTPFVAPVVGGDDLRVVLSPNELFSYATSLARLVHGLAQQATGLGLPPAMVPALANLGIGVGAIIAPYHFPAQRLLEMAHDLEDAAKRSCIEQGHRSALDFVWLRSGEELSEGLDVLGRSRPRPPAIPLGRQHLDCVERAKAIGAVPTSQRAMMVSARAELDEDEFMNLFCYQLARSPAWQGWFERCCVDWCDRQAVAENLPDARLLDIAALVRGEQ